MQRNKTKRAYKSPYLTVVEIDNVVSMQMVSESEVEPPGQPGLSGSSPDSEQSQQESLQKNSFDDNPFRR